MFQTAEPEELSNRARLSGQARRTGAGLRQGLKEGFEVGLVDILDPGRRMGQRQEVPFQLCQVAAISLESEKGGSPIYPAR